MTKGAQPAPGRGAGGRGCVQEIQRLLSAAAHYHYQKSKKDAAGLTSLGSRCFHNAIVRLPARVQITAPFSTKEKKKAQFTLRHTSICKAQRGPKSKSLNLNLEIAYFKPSLHSSGMVEIKVYFGPIFAILFQDD